MLLLNWREMKTLFERNHEHITTDFPSCHLKSLNPQPTICVYKCLSEPQIKSSTWSHPTWFKSGGKTYKRNKVEK